jgi:mRNA interferase MazF
MTAFKLGQIWLVNFDPSYGHEYKKVRPALIIQKDKYIASSSLLAVVPISSQTDKQTELDILIKSNSQNRLMKDSLLKMKQISSFDKGRFIKLIGIIDEATMKLVKKNIKLYLI